MCVCRRVGDNRTLDQLFDVHEDALLPSRAPLGAARRLPSSVAV